MSSRADHSRPGDDRVGDAEARLADIGASIVAAVELHAPDGLVRSAMRVVDAWHGPDGAERARAEAELRPAARDATERVAGELRELFARPAAEQRRSPLEVVRTLAREPTEVLAAAGIPPVVRDDVDERVRPEDPYDLAPRSLAELGDPELGPLLLAWGLAKTRALRGG